MLGTDIDWIDKVMRTGLTQDYNLGVGGSSEYVNYYLSGAYHDEEGLLLNDQFKRYTFNAKVDTKVTDWLKIGANVNFSHRDYSGVSANFVMRQKRLLWLLMTLIRRDITGWSLRMNRP